MSMEKANPQYCTHWRRRIGKNYLYKNPSLTEFKSIGGFMCPNINIYYLFANQTPCYYLSTPCLSKTLLVC